MAFVTSGIDWSAQTHDEVCRRHRWRIPDRLNVAQIACRRHADGARHLALVEVDARGDRNPDAWRVVRHSFDDLDDRSRRLATVLGEMGVGRGDRVAVLLPQRLETALAHLAAFTLGAISVPLSPLFRADALEHRLRASGAKVAVTDEELYGHLAPLRGSLPALASVLCCDGAPRGTESLEAAVRTTARRTPIADTSAEDPAMLVYTSGTGGLPKGALHAHRFLPGRLSGFELAHALEREPSADRPFWTPADWAWIGGLVDCVLTPWVFGCPVLAFRRRAFDPVAALEVMIRSRVRRLFLPPPALRRLRSAGVDPTLYSLEVRSVHTAGEPLPPETYLWAQAAFGAVYELYGMTEVGAVIGNSPLSPVVPGSMGRPYPGHPVVLLDDDDVVEGAGEGEIAVREDDPGLFLRYWDDPRGTARRFRGEHYTTGDVARRDENGYLWYLGRNDDLFNASGYRVGPADVEATLQRHPAVLAAAVVGEPDEERGNVVKAFVVLQPGSTPGEDLAEDIRRFVRDRLAAYEYPRRLIFARELPLTVTGKVRRSELRAPGADARYGLGGAG